MKQRLRELIERGLEGNRLVPAFDVERPKVKEHGEFATNLALILGKREGRRPTEIAQELIEKIRKLDRDGIVEKMEVAGGGFINFTLKRSAWQESLWGLPPIPQIGKGKRVVVEFISANPTGPLHIGNARGGPIGDVLASLLEATGHEVTREYYVNDIGGQIDKLGASLLNALNGSPARAGFSAETTEYQGTYINELAAQAEELRIPQQPGPLGAFGLAQILKEIQKDCEGIGISFNSWVHENKLGPATERVIEKLKKEGVTKEREGALWFAPSDEFLQDRECVLIRSDGRPTYFANDIAYHAEKYEKGFDRLLNIWGSNHHGHVPRMKGALKALGYDPDRLEVVLYQFVRVKRGAEVVKMSKRAGNYVTAREVLDEVGRDALRFFLLMRAPESHLDFDLDLAKKQSQENPVYYVQYAHARLASIFGKAGEKNVPLPTRVPSLDRLNLPEEIELIRRLHQFPEEIVMAVRRLEPQRIPFYLLDLAREFQSYYSRAREDSRYRVLGGDVDTSKAKLYLCAALKNTLAAGLKIIGVTAPERMEGVRE